MAARLLGAALALLAGASLVFLLAAAAPSEAGLALAGEELAPGQGMELARLHGLDAPLPARWLAWLAALLQGDLGRSLRSGAPVATLLAERLPVTLALLLPALLVSTVLGLAAGVAAAGWGGRAAALFGALMTGAHAMPVFLLAQLLVLGLALGLGWLPVQGPGEGLLGWARHLALPVLALALQQVGFLALLARAGVAGEMARPYALAARARGRSAPGVRWRHALPNALPPIVTLLGVRAGALVAGAVVIETVFALPGLGRLAVAAAIARDHPVLMGCVLLAMAGIILASLLADAALALTDPRRRA